MSQTIAVSLPANTLYVSGTVNGVDKTWTNTEGNTWETTAEVASDGKYLVALVIISSLGTSSEESFTLYYGVLGLITDRTEADVRRVVCLAARDYAAMSEAEKAEWDGEMKGAYNASDLNRVESAVDYLAKALLDMLDGLKTYAAEKGVGWDKIFAPPFDPDNMQPDTKTDWKDNDSPTPEDMARYLDNVKLLRNALVFDTEALPNGMDNLTWSGANAIEKALERLDSEIILFRGDMEIMIDNTAAAWYQSGEIFTGEV